MAHPCVEVCPKGAVSLDRFNGRSVIDQRSASCGRCTRDVCQYHAIIRQAFPCAAACGMMLSTATAMAAVDIDYRSAFPAQPVPVNCPFGAIADKSQIFQMIRAIQVKASTPLSAPAFVVASSARRRHRASRRDEAPRFADIIEVAIGADPCAALHAEDFAEEVPRSAVHGDFLLSGVVDDGVKEVVPGTGQLHLDGPQCSMTPTARLVKRTIVGRKG